MKISKSQYYSIFIIIVTLMLVTGIYLFYQHRMNVLESNAIPQPP